MEQQIILIYARAANGVIGKDGVLPWHLSQDLQHFKRKTMGKPMIMGRKTFQSFPSPLPGRRHIVLTRDESWQADGAETVNSMLDALKLAGEGEIAIIGGAEINLMFLPLACRVELTEIHQDYAGDTFMPPLGDDWRECGREDHPASDGQPAYSFVTLERHECG